MSLNAKEEAWVRKQVKREEQHTASQSEFIEPLGVELLAERYLAMQAEVKPHLAQLIVDLLAALRKERAGMTEEYCNGCWTLLSLREEIRTLQYRLDAALDDHCDSH